MLLRIWVADLLLMELVTFGYFYVSSIFCDNRVKSSSEFLFHVDLVLVVRTWSLTLIEVVSAIDGHLLRGLDCF